MVTRRLFSHPKLHEGDPAPVIKHLARGDGAKGRRPGETWL
jgi:hypothetical protein